ncbi:MAG: type II toxin-antitoxin system RelE/ParE family toxin [Coriobacteriia bacterium]|nr:type II toxin-antitoxin system RelE/ParE family toxin [Coriobacteriia bacterium]MCL2537493.1 type II toxin-antitoxin system RelE/ParE family toxin [Coriobacteriia bacterium]
MTPEAKYSARLLGPAQIDLERIALLHLDYVGVESARKITSAILDRIEVLQTFPYIGAEIDDDELRKQGCRGLLCKRRFLCVYRVIDQSVWVYHIVDTRSDYRKRLMRLLPAVVADDSD